MVLDIKLWKPSYVCVAQSKKGTQPVFKYSKITVETLGQGVKYLQS